ncbi:MAG: DsrE family protein [Segetibacter sp.]
MNHKTIPVLLAFIILFSVTVSAQARKKATSAVKAKQSFPVHKVIMQLSSGDTLEHKGLLNNLENLKEGWGDSLAIEIVVHGPGIDLVTKGKSTQENNIRKMIDQGVQFVVCRNTMKQRNIAEDQILETIGFVAMGVGEIVVKQEKGWSYLKAGF